MLRPFPQSIHRRVGFIFLLILTLAAPSLFQKAEAVESADLTPDNSKVYTVKNGDTLWKIARSLYGDPSQWPLLFWNNKQIVKDPENIKAGMIFFAPIHVDSKTVREVVRFSSAYDRLGDKNPPSNEIINPKPRRQHGAVAYASDIYGNNYYLSAIGNLYRLDAQGATDNAFATHLNIDHIIYDTLQITEDGRIAIFDAVDGILYQYDLAGHPLCQSTLASPDGSFKPLLVALGSDGSVLLTDGKKHLRIIQHAPLPPAFTPVPTPTTTPAAGEKTSAH